MELSGKIFKVMPLETGEGKNGVWKKQQIIIETTSDKYPKKVAVQLWGDLTEKGFQEGAEISVEFDVESREYNGKWYTDAKAWRINKNTSDSPAQQQTSTSNQSTTNSTSTTDFDGQTPQIDDDPPF